MKKLSIVSLLAVFTLVGCISYTDPSVKNLNEDQYAVIYLDISLNVVELDGKKVPLNWLTSIDELKLTPGKHSFKIIWDNVDIKTTPTNFDFELEAGAKYDLYRITNTENHTWSYNLERKSDQLKQ